MVKKVFALGCAIAMLFSGCVKRIIIPNPAYAIGVVDIYGPSQRQAYVHYHYIVNNDAIYIYYTNGDRGWHVPTNGHLKTGQQFMVQYNPAKTKEARMMFCFEVKDSSDYNRYIAEFATTAPTCY